MAKSDLIYGSFNTVPKNGIYKLSPINFPSPAKDIKMVPVAGKNGFVVYDTGAYKNVELTAELVIEPQKHYEDILSQYDDIRDAIMTQKGYQRLEDSLYPDEYRLAIATDCMLSEVDAALGKARITFDAKPQRFLKSGELPVAFTDSSKAQQTIYKYSDFSSYTKTSILDPLGRDIKTDLSSALFYVVDMSGVTIADDTMIRVEGGFDEFFVAICSDNPVISSSNASTERFDDTFLLQQGDPRTYWLFPAAANIKIYAEAVLVYESPNTEHKSMVNQTMFGAKPIVMVDIATGYDVTDYLFAIGSNGVMFTQPNIFPYNQTQTITIDCEAMEAYSLPRDNPAGYKVNWNPYVTFVEAPELMPGDNDIAYDATVSNLRIYPNWWRL